MILTKQIECTTVTGSKKNLQSKAIKCITWIETEVLFIEISSGKMNLYIKWFSFKYKYSRQFELKIHNKYEIKTIRKIL